MLEDADALALVRARYVDDEARLLDISALRPGIYRLVSSIDDHDRALTLEIVGAE